MAKTKKISTKVNKPVASDALIFIDTNIFLNFYRYQQGNPKEFFTDQVDKLHSRIITTDQIEMEYKKNHLKFVIKCLEGLKTYGNEVLPRVPFFLRQPDSADKIDAHAEIIRTEVFKIADHLKRILENPNEEDKIYRILEKLFRKNTELHLNRSKEERYTIRRLARKRFWLGYPPRKDKDTSMGDAINWEWIIACAKTHGKDVIIVTCDEDYGPRHDGQLYLNNWLAKEFRDRVENKNIHLTDTLSKALNLIDIEVPPAAEKAELEAVKSARHWVSNVISSGGLPGILGFQAMKRASEAMEAARQRVNDALANSLDLTAMKAEMQRVSDALANSLDLTAITAEMQRVSDALASSLDLTAMKAMKAEMQRVSDVLDNSFPYSPSTS